MTDEAVAPTAPPQTVDIQPAPPPKRKQPKRLAYEQLYLENLPTGESYERSYMHRDTVTHCLVTPVTGFIVTVSGDGHVKFWKKAELGIEFVKHFRAHLAAITACACSVEGALLCTASATDGALKIFDVLNFDMINMAQLPFRPLCVEWVRRAGAPIDTLAVSDSDSSAIYLYDARSTCAQPMRSVRTVHTKAVHLMRYNRRFDVCISVDRNGLVEYWTVTPKFDRHDGASDSSGDTNDIDSGGGDRLELPACCQFETKLDTDLFEFAKVRTLPTGLALTPDGLRFATISTDRRVRLFNFLTGKLILVLDESLPRFTQLQQQQGSTQSLPSMEFSRRMATERDLEKSDSFPLANVQFDESGHFLLYATMLGVKLVNVKTRRCVRIIGRHENLRLLHCALYQGTARRSKAAITVESEAATNPTLDAVRPDPTLFCTAYKKARFYLFSRREADEAATATAEQAPLERDVFNEKPSKEDSVTVTADSLSGQQQQQQRVFETAVLHTVFGDISLALHAQDTPKTVENFCVHARNGYYNGHIFHRVIKGFMVQTGDPSGIGTGGVSIWGGEFDDEIRAHLRHDRPYTVSMANAGANTNGSQFFITLCPTPWLDGKHTVFGRVTKGMEVVQNISNVRTNKTDKPFEDVRIVSVTVK